MGGQPESSDAVAGGRRRAWHDTKITLRRRPRWPTVLPIRVATTSLKARPQDVATAVQMAAAAGAAVIVLGSYVDTGDRAVAAQCTRRSGRNVVVVAPA